MTEHSITPPPELVQHWLGNYFGCIVSGELSPSETFLATQAARWGADQELEACCEQLRSLGPGPQTIDRLRAARRPKPPSLKEQAFALLNTIESSDDACNSWDFSTIRLALEALPDA